MLYDLSSIGKPKYTTALNKLEEFVNGIIMPENLSKIFVPHNRAQGVSINACIAWARETPVLKGLVPYQEKLKHKTVTNLSKYELFNMQYKIIGKEYTKNDDRIVVYKEDEDIYTLLCTYDGEDRICLFNESNMPQSYLYP